MSNERMPAENMIKEALLILQEECAEVIHIANKALRFGIDDIHPVEGIKNRDLLTQEIGDVLVMIDILKTLGVINEVDILKAKIKKIDKLKTWSTLV